MSPNYQSVCVIGVGKIGLPLAVFLSRKYNVVGFDVNSGNKFLFCSRIFRTGLRIGLIVINSSLFSCDFLIRVVNQKYSVAL